MVVIGTLIEKEAGINVFEQIQTLEGVEYAFVETARSDDLFQEKQFGGFGEAAVLTLLVADVQKDKVFNALQNLCGLEKNEIGQIFMNQAVMKSTL